MIYLDHNATSPMLPEVLAAMEPWFGVPANPASAHRAGQAARMAVERAREHVAALVGAADPQGVVFTSGATEANQTFLRGQVAAAPIEHPSVKSAATVSLEVTADGRIVPRAVADIVAIMAANHETGVLQPVAEALALGVPVHVDATQAAGRIPLQLAGAAGIALSSHKLGGPGGVGALILPDGEPFPPLLRGGSQERGRRAGTVNTAGVVGFGEACRLARIELDTRRQRWADQSGRLREAIVRLGGRVVGTELLPQTTCAVFPGLPGEGLVQALDLRGVCVSHGAACASGSLEPSPVLTAMGDPEPAGAVRFSLGPRTTDVEVDGAIGLLPEVLDALRAALDW